MPLLIVSAAAGVVVLDHMGGDRAPGRSRLAAAVLSAVTVLAVVGIFVVLSTTWVFQRFVIPPDEAARAAALRTQASIARSLHTPAVPVRRVGALPRRTVPGQLVVVGRCAGLYYGLDQGWVAIETSSAIGDTGRVLGEPSRTRTCNTLVRADGR